MSKAHTILDYVNASKETFFNQKALKHKIRIRLLTMVSLILEKKKIWHEIHLQAVIPL